jgi:hypothetical protein
VGRGVGVGGIAVSVAAGWDVLVDTSDSVGVSCVILQALIKMANMDRRRKPRLIFISYPSKFLRLYQF